MNSIHFLRGIVALCILIIPVGATPNGVRQLTFGRVTTYDNVLPADAVNVTTPSQTRSRIHCSTRCREEEWCNSYFYNYVTRTCLRHRVVYLTPPPSNAMSEAGWQYFRPESVCPTGENYVADRLSSTCYRLALTQTNWTTARVDCAANGEMLTVLEPVVKAQFIQDFMSANSYHTLRGVHIGATQSPQSAVDFTWLNGEPLSVEATKSFWVEGKPARIVADGVLLMRYLKAFRWSEGRREKKMHSICERPFLK